MNRMQLSAVMTGDIDSQDGLIVKVVATRAIGEVTDASGQDFDLNEPALRQLVDNYNRRVNEQYEKVKTKGIVAIAKGVIEKLVGKQASEFTINEIALLPVQYEHSIDNRNTIGRVVGLMKLGDWDGKLSIFADLLITEPEAIRKIKGGILHQVSISFSVPDMEPDEISFTTYGAVEGSEIISYSKNYNIPKTQENQEDMNDHSIKLARIQAIDKELQLCRNKREKIQFKQENKKIAQNLITKGIMYSRYKRLIENDLNQFSSKRDRDIATRILFSLPSVIKPESNCNKLALKAEELLMTDDNKILKERARTFYDECEIIAQQRIELSRKKMSEDKEDDKKEENEDRDMSSESIDKMEDHIHGPEHNAHLSEDEERSFNDRMMSYAKEGNEAAKEYCHYKKLKYADDADTSPTEVKQVPMSESDKEDKEKDDKALDDVEKEEAELSAERDELIQRLSAHFSKYTKKEGK